MRHTGQTPFDRHMLLRMKKELRMRSAAARRTQLTSARMKNIEDKERCKSSSKYSLLRNNSMFYTCFKIQLSNKATYWSEAYIPSQVSQFNIRIEAINS